MFKGMRVSILAWLTVQAAGARFTRSKNNATLFLAADIPCPTLAVLYKMGKLNVNAKGVISNKDLATALGEDILAHPRVVGLLAYSAANFLANDPHQVKKQEPNGQEMYLNLFTMNPDDSCSEGAKTHLQLDCNANPEFQNHGYSTTIRHAKYGGSRLSRFQQWFKSDVFEKPSWSSERIVTVRGLSKMLSRARTGGDKSGEGSLNSNNQKPGSNLEFYHPSVKSWRDTQAATQWQAISAYAMFMAAWGRKRDGLYYLTESDLRSFWLHDRKRSGWSARAWGWKETFAIMKDMQNTGAGNEWTTMMAQSLSTIPNPSEDQLFGAYVGAIKSIQFQADYKFKTA